MRKILSTLLCLIALMVTPAAAAQETDDDVRSRLGVHGSYGSGAEINGSLPVDFATVSLRWGRTIRGFRPFGGESSWGLEGTAFAFDQEPSTPGLGLHLVYELRAPDAEVTPVLRIGLGALGTTRRLPAEETFHNFSLFAGLGVEVALGPTRWLEVGYRLHHVSNADTGVRNLGINAHSLVLGFSWRLGS